MTFHAFRIVSPAKGWKSPDGKTPRVSVCLRDDEMKWLIEEAGLKGGVPIAAIVREAIVAAKNRSMQP